MSKDKDAPMTEILPPMPDGLPDVELNENAKVVLARRYLRKGLDGKPFELPRELFWRVAAKIAAQEAKFKGGESKVEPLAREFYDLLTSFKFLPNSPTLMLGTMTLCPMSATRFWMKARCSRFLARTRRVCSWWPMRPANFS